MGEIVHLFRRFDEKGVFFTQTLVAGEDLIDLVVRHARLGADDGFGEARTKAAAARVHLHECGEGETVDVRVERADAVGQRERQHGHDVTGEVDRGAAAERLCIERGVRRDIVADVRDVDAEQIMAVIELFERDRVVEVLRVVAVDGKDELVAQVETLSCAGEVDLLRNGVRLLQDLVREYVEHAVFMQDGRDRRLHRAVFAERRRDDALRMIGVVAVARHLDGHAVADLCVADVAAADRDLGVFFGRGLHEKCLAALHELAGQLLSGAAEDAQHRRLAAAAVVLALADLDEHPVAVPCAAAGVRRNEIVVRFGLTRIDVGRDKGKAALGREERAGGAAVVRGHRKTVFLVFHDLSVLRQTVERIL